MKYTTHPIIDHLRVTLAARQKQRLDGTTVNGVVLKPAAVLLLLYEREGEHHMLFTKRTSQVEDHKGQISFPGGAYHDGVDLSLQHTALRESEEEVGLRVEHTDILGELDDLRTISDYLVAPFVGVLRQPQAFVLAPAEVAELVEVPLNLLLDPRTLRSDPVEYAGRLINQPYYYYQGHVIYGATARILAQFLSLLPLLSS